jgi:hypothetical protein
MCVGMLCRKGTLHVRARAQGGWTPLAFAADGQYTATVAELMRLRADVEARDDVRGR